MPYAPAERLFQLARSLAATRMGLSLTDMANELGVTRRTAERLRDSLLAMFPQMESEDDHLRVRRWRLPASALMAVVAPKSEEVAAVEVAAREFEARGETNRAALLRGASTALRALMQPAALRRAEPDIAALMEAEGIAMRPGPRPIIGQGVLPALRRAILGMNLIDMRYAARGAGSSESWTVCPYGLLYGGRGWLVAHVDGRTEMRLWRLDRIEMADVLNQTFDRREDFSLRDYAAQSFGVFQEPPVDVTLRFSASAAEDAARWSFHPSQTIAMEADGSATVTLRAGGVRELLWHLVTWGDTVMVLAPESLRVSFADMTASLARHHASKISLQKTPPQGASVQDPNL